MSAAGRQAIILSLAEFAAHVDCSNGILDVAFVVFFRLEVAWAPALISHTNCRADMILPDAMCV